jgi:hypothetical protein
MKYETMSFADWPIWPGVNTRRVGVEISWNIIRAGNHMGETERLLRQIRTILIGILIVGGLIFLKLIGL